MSKNKSFIATPALVRSAFHNGDLTVPDDALASMTGGPQGRGRGRVAKFAVEAFIALNPGAVYAEKSGAGVKTVEVPMFSPKTGRAVKSLTKTLAEVRTAAGIEGKKGRISGADLHVAALAFGSGEPKTAKSVTAPVAEKTAKV